MTKQLICVLCLLASKTLLADDMSIFRLSVDNRVKVFNYLENNQCTCGCDMSIGYCLREDPSCTVSPKMARTAINYLLSAKTSRTQQSQQIESQTDSQNRPQIYNFDGGGGYVSDGECSYVSYGGMSFKNCD